MNGSMHTSKGFTLMELLMVISITGILAAVGTASFKYVSRSNRTSSEINGLLGDLQFARSQAIKTGSFVTICPSSTGTTCTGNSTWTGGWIIFLDFNGNGTVDTATDKVIRAQKSISPDVLVSSATAFKYIVFNREGFGSNSLTTAATINLDTNPSNAQWRRCLWVSPVGATQVEKGGDISPTTC
jgi:type IV fimbrial biogenesis protein FimT